MFKWLIRSFIAPVTPSAVRNIVTLCSNGSALTLRKPETILLFFQQDSPVRASLVTKLTFLLRSLRSLSKVWIYFLASWVSTNGLRTTHLSYSEPLSFYSYFLLLEEGLLRFDTFVPVLFLFSQTLDTFLTFAHKFGCPFYIYFFVK
jgi:hypothetical protein